MIEFFKNRINSKREVITYVIIALWLALGIVSTYHTANFTDLATYFISLTGFVTVYIFGESVRLSAKSSIFLPGKTSKREAIIYITVIIWFVIGLIAIITKSNLADISTYFASLTPFVGSYVIGETFKAEHNNDEIKQLNS